MTHLWESGTPVNVWVVDEQPKRLVWNETVHPVLEIVKQWRIDQGWWRLRVWRDYFTVETTTGLLLDIYHDLLKDKWYVQRWYD